MSQSVDEVSNSLLMQRHAHYIEASVASLLQAWRSHFERVPAEIAQRKHLIVALGTLGSGGTPRDPARIAALPATLLEPAQLEAVSAEIDGVHQDLAASVGAQVAPPEKG